MKLYQLPGGTTAAEVTGEGLPLLTLHGAEADRHNFDALTPLLGPYAKVVAYDQRGCGQSGGRAEDGSLLDLADEAVQLLDALDLSRAVVLGTSLGGRIAQAIAARHPDRVVGLVLCNTWPLDRRLDGLNPEGTARLGALRAGLPESGAELAAMFYSRAYVDAHPQLAARFGRKPMNPGRSRLAGEAHPVAPESIAIPALLLSGAEDPIVPTAVMREMAAQMPGAQLEVISGAAHSMAVQSPGSMVAPIRSFLARCWRDL